MIDTKKAKLIVPQEGQNKQSQAKMKLKDRPFALYLSWIQISLAIVIVYIYIESEQRTEKDAWIVFTAIIPMIAIMILSPIMLVVAGFYFYNNRDGSLINKLIVGVASAVSLIGFLFTTKI